MNSTTEVELSNRRKLLLGLGGAGIVAAGVNYAFPRYPELSTSLTVFV